MKDYYKILQVERTATQEEKKFHPDVNKNNPKAEEVFKEMNEAYGILGDENKRAEYDNKLFGKEEQNIRGFQQKTNFEDRPSRRKRTQSAAPNFQNTGNIFENFFGFDPNGQSVNMSYNNENVRPMKTKDAYRHIFGEGRFR